MLYVLEYSLSSRGRYLLGGKEEVVDGVDQAVVAFNGLGQHELGVVREPARKSVRWSWVGVRKGSGDGMSVRKALRERYVSRYVSAQGYTQRFATSCMHHRAKQPSATQRTHHLPPSVVMVSSLPCTVLNLAPT